MFLPRWHTVQHCGDPVAASVTCHPFIARWPATTGRHRPSKLSHEAEGSWPGACREGARRHPGTRTSWLGSWLPRGPSAHRLGQGVPSRGRQPLLWSGPGRPPKMSGPQAPRGSGETPAQTGAPGLGVAASRGRGSCRVFSLEGWGTVGTRPHVVLPQPRCILKSPELVKDFNTCCWLQKESFNKGAPGWLRRLSI